MSKGKGKGRGPSGGESGFISAEDLRELLRPFGRGSGGRICQQGRVLALDMLARLSVFAEISAMAEEELKKDGFNPDAFVINPEAWERFVSMEDFAEPDEVFNGPWYDAKVDGRLVRLAASVEMGDEDMDFLLVLFRIGEGDEAWETFIEGEWVDDGPPEEFFDMVLAGIDPDEDFEDEEDDGDEWLPDRTIAQMNLSVDTYNALDAAGIDTLDDLALLKEKTVLALLGPKGLAEVKAALALYDVELE